MTSRSTWFGERLLTAPSYGAPHRERTPASRSRGMRPRPSVWPVDPRVFSCAPSSLVSKMYKRTVGRFADTPEGSDRVPTPLRILHDIIALLQENKIRSSADGHMGRRPIAQNTMVLWLQPYSSSTPRFFILYSCIKLSHELAVTPSQSQVTWRALGALPSPGSSP